MENDFREFLKRGGRSLSAIKRVLAYVEEFTGFLADQRDRDPEEADQGDLEAFVAKIEEEPKASAKGHLWGLVYFFDFTDNLELKSLSRVLREERIERRPFPVHKFRGLDPAVIDKLAAAGIKHVKHVLAAGATPQRRDDLAARAGVPEDVILEIVKLADLARIPGLKGIRARLYLEAGVDTVEKLAAWEAEPLRDMLVEFVDRTGFDGIAPLPAEIRYSIAKAKGLPRTVSY